jgi:hypothetical protein
MQTHMSLQSLAWRHTQITYETSEGSLARVASSMATGGETLATDPPPLLPAIYSPSP